MLKDLSGLNYIGAVTSKKVTDHKTDKTKKYYSLNCAFMGGYQQISCDKEIYDTIPLDVECIFPVRIFTKETMSSVMMFVRDDANILDLDGNLIKEAK